MGTVSFSLNFFEGETGEEIGILGCLSGIWSLKRLHMAGSTYSLLCIVFSPSTPVLILLKSVEVYFFVTCTLKEFHLLHPITPKSHSVVKKQSSYKIINSIARLCFLNFFLILQLDCSTIPTKTLFFQLHWHHEYITSLIFSHFPLFVFDTVPYNFISGPTSTLISFYCMLSLPRWLRRWICLQYRRPRFNPWVGNIPWKS